MISKELLSEVLGHDDICNERIIQNKLLYMCKNDGMIDYEYEYNIYELAHKCKEWAFDNGYELRSGRDIDVKEELCYFCEYKQERQLDYANGNYFLADTETESIFKACQWILETKES